MSYILPVAFIFAALAVVFLFMLMRSRRSEAACSARLESEMSSRSADALRVASELESLRLEKENALAEAAAGTREIMRLREELVREQANVASLRESALKDKEELGKLQETFRLEFRNLANEILEEKSNTFKSTNKEAIEALLKPFRDNITDFRTRVEKIYSDENIQRGALQNEIKNLMELNNRITQETTNLTNALKGNSKVQGDWGEMILQTILESSHLEKGIHYHIQQNFKDVEGNNLRPDVVLSLPDKKKIIIDSKVSLTSYTNYVGCEENAESDRFIKEHIQSVRRHVDELGSKRYQELVESPDFVIMFIPNEPAFLCALQNDNSIWNDAYRRKVIISSPTNLFALLKIVDDLWKRDAQSRHSIEIADEAGKMYDKLAGLVETMESVGRHLNSASTAHEKAMKQLDSGSGNLIGRSEKLRRLGARASKNLPEKMVAKALDEFGETAVSNQLSDVTISEDSAH